jgi:hypothetical protein
MHLVKRKGAFSHFINRFDNVHPRKIDLEDIQVLRASQAYFARKFPDDPAAPVRQRVLSELAGVATADSGTTATEGAAPSSAPVTSSAARPVSPPRAAPAPALTTMARALKAAESGLHASLGHARRETIGR